VRSLTVQCGQCAHLQYSVHSALTVDCAQSARTDPLIRVHCAQCAHLQYSVHSALTVECAQSARTDPLIRVHCAQCAHLQYSAHSALTYSTLRTVRSLTVQCAQWCCCAHNIHCISAHSARCTRTAVPISVRKATCDNSMAVTSSSYASKFQVNSLPCLPSFFKRALY